MELQYWPHNNTCSMHYFGTVLTLTNVCVCVCVSPVACPERFQGFWNETFV